MGKLKFHDLTISAVRADTASSVEISFDIPAALAFLIWSMPSRRRLRIETRACSA